MTRWTRPVGLACVLIVWVTVGCGNGGDDTPQASDPTSADRRESAEAAAPWASGVDEVELKKLFDVGESMVTVLDYTPGFESVALGVYEGWGQRVLLNGKPVGPLCQSIHALGFERGEGPLSFIAVTGAKLERKYQVHRDGKPVGEKLEALSSLTPDPDGRSLYYLAGSILMRDGEPVGTERYGEVRFLEFLPGTGELVFAAERDGQWFLVRDGKPEGERYDDIHQLVVHPTDGSVLVHAQRGERARVVWNGKIVGKEYEGIRCPTFSPDGRSVLYFARSDGRVVLVRDGDETLIATDAGSSMVLGHDLTFTAEGEVAAYVVGEGEHVHVVRNGQRIGGPYLHVSDLVLGADGRTLVYVAKVDEDHEVVIRDEERLGDPVEYGIGTLHLGPDGRTVVHTATFGPAALGGQSVILRDGKPCSKPFDLISHGRASADGRSVVFLGQRGSDILRVEMDW